MSRIATAARATTSHRRVVMSDSHALLAQPAFHLAADRGQPLRRRRLVAGDDYRLRVAGADQAPSVSEQHAHAVDVDHIVAGAEMAHRPLHETELERLRH